VRYEAQEAPREGSSHSRATVADVVAVAVAVEWPPARKIIRFIKYRKFASILRGEMRSFQIYAFVYMYFI